MSNATAEPPITTVWPQGFPADRNGISGFAVREIAAPADAVFAWVRRPDLHTDWYSKLRFVRHVGGAWPQLERGTKLSFMLGAVLIPPVRIVQCDPGERRLAWAAKGPGLAACHAFTVADLGDGKSLLRSEERWVGPVARLTSPLTKGTLQKVQTDWAAAVAAAATAHPAGPPQA